MVPPPTVLQRSLGLAAVLQRSLGLASVLQRSIGLAAVLQRSLGLASVLQRPLGPADWCPGDAPAARGPTVSASGWTSQWSATVQFGPLVRPYGRLMFRRSGLSGSVAVRQSGSVAIFWSVSSLVRRSVGPMVCWSDGP